MITFAVQSMKKVLTIFAAALSFCTASSGQEAPGLEWYGFIRTYFAYDTRESSAGTEDLFFYMPKDRNIVDGVDLNGIASFRYAALTSRLGLDITGYEVRLYKIGGKIEADFYSGVSGVTGIAQLRFRQAYVTVAKAGHSWKIGQAWHPMAINLPDIFSLESGAPFGAFSRTPQVLFNGKIADRLSIDAAAVWQMQYTSVGPSVSLDSKTGTYNYKTAAASADFINYSLTPEVYLGLNFKSDGILLRLGADLVSIKPRNYDYDLTTGKPTKTVNDRISTFNFFQFGQFKAGGFTIKEKLIYAQDGSHFSLVGGYGVSRKNTDGSWMYSPTRSLSSWATVRYQGRTKWIPAILLGYVKEFGTREEIIGDFWCKNSADKVNRMYRIQPEIIYRLGRLELGLEYMVTSVQYGTPDAYKLASADLHWVANHRVQALVKFSF